MKAITQPSGSEAHNQVLLPTTSTTDTKSSVSTPAVLVPIQVAEVSGHIHPPDQPLKKPEPQPLAIHTTAIIDAGVVIPKLSKRLNTLIELASPFKIIWDICCDHGKVAIALAARDDSNEVHGIDISKSVVEKLKTYVLPGNLSVACMNAAKVKIHNQENEVVIIAGVGSVTANKIIDGLLSEPGENRSSFLISIHHTRAHTVQYLTDRYGYQTVQQAQVRERKKNYSFNLMAPASILS